MKPQAIRTKPYETRVIFGSLGIFLSVAGAIVFLLLTVAFSNPRPTSTGDINEARNVSRICTRSGGNAHIRTIWTNTKPRVPSHYLITCHK